VFHDEWERRAFAITLAAGFLGKMEIGRLGYGSWAGAPQTSVANGRMTSAAMHILVASPG
jgi:nitrile hydratase beta subunit-like protein